MSVALSIKSLKKVYSNNFHALKNVNLLVEEGDFFALLGSNGAGKTSIIGVICGLLNKTSGDISVLGLDQDAQTNRIKRMIGLMPQEFNFNPFEVIEDILIWQAGYYGIDKKIAKKKAQVLLKRVDLWDRRLDTAKSLSGGMKRRLMLARALIHNPKILILDEPTAGVDVEVRRSIWQFLIELNNQGMTIILTTHYLEEAEFLCRNIAILNNGEIIEQTSIKKLLSKIPQQILILESVEQLPKSIPDMSFNVKRLDDYSLQVTLEATMDITHTLKLLSEQGIYINHIRSVQNRLETLFFHLTAKDG